MKLYYSQRIHIVLNMQIFIHNLVLVHTINLYTLVETLEIIQEKTTNQI